MTKYIKDQQNNPRNFVEIKIEVASATTVLQSWKRQPF